ncbi:MAG: autotransporter outer membrane beta-barrel domain-containing protein, partial [Phreatobacter sp.]|uniref:autotransporter outer membrane beta-barrel domain-containing protein n=1 Tax=Phreatobacter sp. TaxID=1966341 RepID=UPI001A5AE044
GGVNPRNVAAGIDAALNGGATPPAAFNPILGLYGAPLAASLNRLSGEAATGASATSLTSASTFLGIMLDPMAGSRGGTAAAPGSSLIEMADMGAARTPAARLEAAWSIWTRAYGQAGRTASDAGLGAAGTASSIYGVAAGADKLVAPNLVVGFALAGGGTSFGLGALGSGTGDFAQLGAYASMRLGPGYLSGALAYGWNRFDVTRNVVALGVTETYRSGPVGHTFGGRIETGRRFALGIAGVTPYAAAEAIAYIAPGYRETWVAPATGAFALAYAGRTTGTLRAELGARADALVASAETGNLIAFSRLAYAVQSNTQRAAEARFQALAGSTFTVFGARASTHTALATLGVEARFRQGLNASLALDGELGDRHRSIRGSVALRQSW